MEILLVMFVMLIMASLLFPVAQRSLTSVRLRKAADIVRTHWAECRIRAMEEGQILCCRCEINGDQMLVDRVLDVHFTAALSSQADRYTLDTNNSFTLDSRSMEGSLDSSGFTGSEDDFILRDPSLASEEFGAQFITLPEGVRFGDGLAVPDARAAYYTGMVMEETEMGGYSMEQQQIMDQDGRYGEMTGGDGRLWSAPIFFFPDGSTSTAAVLLQNDNNRCVEVRLRGLTGGTSVMEVQNTETYNGLLMIR